MTPSEAKLKSMEHLAEQYRQEARQAQMELGEALEHLNALVRQTQAYKDLQDEIAEVRGQMYTLGG